MISTILSIECIEGLRTEGQRMLFSHIPTVKGGAEKTMIGRILGVNFNIKDMNLDL